MLILFFSCEQADLILDKISEDTTSSFSNSEENISEETAISEDVPPCSTESSDVSDNHREEDHPEENWDWGEDNNEATVSFEGEFEGYFEMYNTQSHHLLCQTEEASLMLYDNILEASSPCTTPNGHQLYIYFTGALIDTDQHQDVHYAYAQSQGMVFVEVPSGDIFESSFFGESQFEGGYIWNYLTFEIEIVTPNGSRYYFGSLYTY